MRIGVDFDNTLADYDALFVALAVEEGLLAEPVAGGKREVRDRVRSGAGGETAWRRLQAQAYGPRMAQAVLMPGADEFLSACKRLGLQISIVSHKSRRAADETVTVDLREAALAWMREQGLFADFGVSRDQVFFEDTRKAKVERIADLRCSHFVDDLEEVFLTPGFPDNVYKILFDPAGESAGPFAVCRTWEEIADACFSNSGIASRRH
jgi:hypothetical protein